MLTKGSVAQTRNASPRASLIKDKGGGISKIKQLGHAKSFRVKLSVFLAAQHGAETFRPVEENDWKLRLPFPHVKQFLQ
jgi:hypothetical protein